ncbi:MAG: hypothetical protein OJF62_002683 [Pseudolabrys sp.]|nr:hypothetical protein [Pseudolabrys sp.]
MRQLLILRSSPRKRGSRVTRCDSDVYVFWIPVSAGMSGKDNG